MSAGTALILPPGNAGLKAWSDTYVAGALAAYDANGDLNPKHVNAAINATIGLQLSIAATQTVSFSILLGATGNSVIQPINASSGAITATLPQASTVPAGSVVILKKLDNANNITVARSSSDTIDGGTSLTMSTQWGVERLYTDGVSGWFTF